MTPYYTIFNPNFSNSLQEHHAYLSHILWPLCVLLITCTELASVYNDVYLQVGIVSRGQNKVSKMNGYGGQPFPDLVGYLLHLLGHTAECRPIAITSLAQLILVFSFIPRPSHVFQHFIQKSGRPV